MAPRKRTKAAEKEPQSSLSTALDFIKVAQVDKITELQIKSHCRIANGYVVAFDGVLAVGHPIEEEMSLCPQTFRLIDALAKCRQVLSITQLEGDRLVIKSGRFRAVIPCLNPAALPYVEPDAQVGAIDDTIKEGFTLLNHVVKASGYSTLEASLLLQNNSMLVTDRQVIIEYWHGINLPDGLVIPKEAINAVCKIKAKLVGIGASSNTVTFHYDNKAWLRTNLYAGKWPDIERVLNSGDHTKATPIPPALFDAVDAVASFSPDGAIHTFDGYVGSHNTDVVGATYELDGITPGLCFGHQHIKSIKNMATSIDMAGANGVTYFYGERIRGAMAQRRG